MTDDQALCVCSDPAPHPRVLWNRPGLDRIDYRVGDFSSFRDALLLPRPGEQALAAWRPKEREDLAVQLLEWWAYLADVLVFYNERTAASAYLRTAELPEQITRLVRTLGWRPRPGIGATGNVALLVSAKLAIEVFAGLPLQSKPGAGKPPQIFEGDVAVIAEPPGDLAVDPLTAAPLNGSASVLLRGVVTSVAPNDELIIVNRGWTVSSNDYAVRSVKSVSVEKDVRGSKNTRVTFSQALTLGSNAPAESYRLLRAEQTSSLYGFRANGILNDTSLHLAGLSRTLRAGSLAVLRIGSAAPKLIKIEHYSEAVWFANAPSQAHPEQGPAATSAIPLAVPHSQLTFKPALTAAPTATSSVVVSFALREVGQLLNEPVTQLVGTEFSLRPRSALPTSIKAGKAVLIEDASGRGALATVLSAGPERIDVTLPGGTATLTTPLRLLYNLLPVSRGATVAKEILGSGDASRGNQSFVLKKFPLTYLPASSGSTGGIRSTLRVWIDGVEWTEVVSLFDQAPTARCFVTREDDEWRTSVSFGDGIHGARLPTGKDNVVASYRYGSGADMPAATTLTTLLKPVSGLRAPKNPLGVTGGADPEPSTNARRNAPRSVLTLGRAISADDYESIAAQAPGVTRARAAYAWDGARQRATVTVYVGDDDGAAASARATLRSAADPNVPINVVTAVARKLTLTLRLIVARGYDLEPVVSNVRTALLDAHSGLFGLEQSRIGAAVYESQIHRVCLGVAGVTAVRDLSLTGDGVSSGPRFSPGSDGFFELDAARLFITAEESSDGD